MFFCPPTAQRDVDGMLAGAGSPYTFQLDRLYAGEDSDSAASEAKVLEFIKAEASDGVGAVVAGYVSDKTLLVAKEAAADAGVVLLASASGLPELPPPRDAVVRFWPSDRWQVRTVRVHPWCYCTILLRTATATTQTRTQTTTQTTAQTHIQARGCLGVAMSRTPPPATPLCSTCVCLFACLGVCVDLQRRSNAALAIHSVELRTQHLGCAGSIAAA